MPRLTAADLQAARDRTVDDVLPGDGDPPLRVLFCGINPGLVSAATGHHFGRPGNRFWPALHGAGFTPRLLRPAEQAVLRRLGYGITNLVARATARADELTAAEIVAGGDRLRALVERTRPAWLAVVGITAFRTAFAAPRAVIGRQDVRLGGVGRLGAPQPERPERALAAARDGGGVLPPAPRQLRLILALWMQNAVPQPRETA